MPAGAKCQMKAQGLVVVFAPFLLPFSFYPFCYPTLVLSSILPPHTPSLLHQMLGQAGEMLLPGTCLHSWAHCFLAGPSSEWSLRRANDWSPSSRLVDTKGPGSRHCLQEVLEPAEEPDSLPHNLRLCPQKLSWWQHWASPTREVPGVIHSSKAESTRSRNTQEGQCLTSSLWPQPKFSLAHKASGT